VIDRVHDHATHRRADATPANRTGLAVLTQVVFAVRNFTNGRAAVDVHLAHLGGAQANRRVHAFASGQLGRAAGAAGDLRALAGLQLDAVNGGADRDVTQLHRIARFDRGFRARHDHIASGDVF